MGGRFLSRVALAGAVIAGGLIAGLPGATAQAPKTYVLQEGDDLPGLAAKLKPGKATLSQTGVALVRGNQKTIWERYDKVNRRLTPGTVLQVPDEATALKLDAQSAEREFSRMWRGEQHYRAAVALERSRDMFYAFVSYVEAAKLGHGLARYRLGQLYDRDMSGFVSHDLMESAMWYEKARESEVNVPGQKARTTGAFGVPTH